MEIGKYNNLYISRRTDHGFYLQDEFENEVLLPNAFITPSMQIDDLIEVFVYKDSEERIVATTERPFAQVDQFAYLKVKDVNENGAYLDWGVVKDLFVPFGEQIEKMEVGKSYVVYILVDEKSDRLIGSGRIKDFVFFDEINLKEGDEVNILPFRTSELGMNVIVNNLFLGLVFHSDIHTDIKIGVPMKGYVKKVRVDGKLDITLNPLGTKNNILHAANVIMSKLEVERRISVSDKSSPEQINALFGMSKKAFKRGIGHLYKQKKITIQDDYIEVISK